jgi:plasmid stabilization system protein ParE
MSGQPPLAVRFHPQAANELRRAVRWYARRSATVSTRFVNAVDDAIVRLAANPGVGTLFRWAARCVRVRRFPYVLYYEPTDAGELMLYAVAHTSRRPGYWLRRRSNP